MTFLAKVRTLTLGTAYDLVNKITDLNSPSMLRQDIRDLETGISQMKSASVISGGNIRTLTREIGDTTLRITDKTAAIKTVMAGTAANKDTVARAYASSLLTLQQQLKDKNAELISSTADEQGLDEAITKMNTKHDTLVAALRRLESMDRQTKAKNFAAGAMQSAAAMTSSGADVSVDDIVGRMTRANDVASERFDRAMADPSFADDPTHAADVDALLASLK